MKSSRCGMVALIGRPNVGKSTLANAIVGEQIAITSSRPQTTRRVIRGILTRGEDQLVLVDLPGVHRARTLLGETLNRMAIDLLSDVDVVAMLFPANEALGRGDRELAERVFSDPESKKVAIVTKADLVGKPQMVRALTEVANLGNWEHIIPISAKTEFQISELTELLISMLPESPHLFPSDSKSDVLRGDQIAEIIRGGALELLREELPHSLAVTLDEVQEIDELLEIHASLWVERDSQKGIVIGKDGVVLKTIGSSARVQIKKQFNRPVRLFLHVRVAKDWQNQPKQLGRLGFSV